MEIGAVHHSSSGLSSLVLVGINLGGGSGAFPHLRDILTHCTSLHCLDLSNNRFRDEEGEEIFSSFDTRKGGNSLRRLSILSNTRYDVCFGENCKGGGTITSAQYITDFAPGVWPLCL